jgi:hypothetical protein
LESENLTDSLDDQAADWLLNWGVGQLPTLLANVTTEEEADMHTHALMKTMRQLNKLGGMCREGASEGVLPEITVFWERYKAAFGTAQAHPPEAYEALANQLMGKSAEYVLPLLVSFAQPAAAETEAVDLDDPLAGMFNVARNILNTLGKPPESKPDSPTTHPEDTTYYETPNADDAKS